MTIRGRKLLEALLQAVEGGSPFTQEIIVKSRHLFEDGTLLARPTGSLERIQMIPSPFPTLAKAKMKQSCSRMDTIFRHFFELSWKSNLNSLIGLFLKRRSDFKPRSFKF